MDERNDRRPGDLRERMVLVETFSRQSDPRQGLQHHVDGLLGLLGRHFALSSATLRLQGPEPRIFQWQPTRPALELEDPELGPWRQRLEACHLRRSRPEQRHLETGR